MGDRFPAERAKETVHHLAGTIGLRIPGQPGFQQALNWLRQELESIPGWEVEVQEAAAGRPWGNSFVGTRHLNLVARLPGMEKSAVLVNSHLDSPPSSVGAADDGAAVAVMLEAARLLAAGPRPRYSLIFLFNGSEESGLQGSLSFVEQHPWAKEVAAFVNLEAAGCSGPFTLFQASSRLPAVLKAYGGVDRPAGSVLAQDLWDSGIFKNDTDYRVFAGHGLHGVDLGLTGDGYAYHTWRDQPDRVSLATLQEMGTTLMALLHHLDREPDLTPRAKPERQVYFDILGRFFIAYPKGLSPILLAAMALFGLYAIWGLPWWIGLLRHLGIALSALLLPTGAAWVMGRLTGFTNWWRAHPLPTVIAWVSLALAGMAAVQTIAPLPVQTGWAGGLLFFLLLGGLAVWRRLGSAYVPTAWALSGAAGLLLWPDSPLSAVAIAVGGGALVTASTFGAPIRFMLAHLGRNPLSHIIVGGLFGFLTLLGATFLPLPASAVWVALPAALAALGVAALLPGFTPARPEQINVTDLFHAGGSHRLCSPLASQFSPALRRQLGNTLKNLDGPLWKGHMLAGKATVATALTASSSTLAPPDLRIVSDETTETRRLTVQLVSTGYSVVFSTDEPPLEVTVDAGGGAPLSCARHRRIQILNPPPEGIRVTFTLPAGTPCRLIASSWYLSDTTPAFPASTSVLYQRVAATELVL